MKDEYVNKNSSASSRSEKDETKMASESVELSSHEEIYQKYLDTIRIKQNDYEEFKSNAFLYLYFVYLIKI